MRALVLMSGGIDSPVAAHILQEQGFDLEAIHFSLEPFTDAAPQEKSTAALRILGIDALHVVPSGPAFGTIAKTCAHRLYFVLSKRFMVRVACAFAREHGIPYVVTGENLGQVSSQTLSNLAAIEDAADRPVLRPLLGYDKVDIVRIAEEIDTFRVSVGPEVCDILGPERPATRSSVEECRAEETKLDLDALVAEMLAGIRRVGVVAGVEAPAA